MKKLKKTKTKQKTVKKAVKRPVNKTKTPKKKAKVVKVKAQKPQKPIGKVTHFFSGIKVAIVKFKKPVRVGTTIRISGATTDFTQKIVSMQFEHEQIKMAKKGKSVGIKVNKKVREGDMVYVAK